MTNLTESQDCFREGIALFNSRRFFDAHEVLEDVWRATPHGARRLHLQGLVQLAVAFHHHSTGNHEGARTVLERALGNLHGADESFPDLDMDRIRKALQPWRAHLAQNQNPREGSRPDLPQLQFRTQSA